LRWAVPLGRSLGGDRYPVAVVERRQMEAWAELLREAGVSAHQWVPETLALPHAEGWDLMPDGERVLVRSGDFSGFACDADNLPMMVSLLAGEDQLPEAARVYGASAVQLVGVDVSLDSSQLQPLDILARGWVQGPVIDLLQGAYSRREEWGRLLRPWKATAALLLAGLLLAGVSAGLNYHRLTQQQTQLTADIEALYRKTFPNARRIVNPRLQMEQQLKQLRVIAPVPAVPILSACSPKPLTSYAPPRASACRVPVIATAAWTWNCRPIICSCWTVSSRRWSAAVVSMRKSSRRPRTAIKRSRAVYALR